MPSLIFDTCCCCINLKTGCFIIGYLELVVEIIIGLLVAVVAFTGGAILASEKQETQVAGGAMLAVGVIALLVLALLLAFTITLLVGLHKNKRGHVKAYLVYSAIFLILSVLGWFGNFSQSPKAENVVSNLLGIVLHAYFFLVIRSHYHKMDDRNKGAIYNTA